MTPHRPSLAARPRSLPAQPFPSRWCPEDEAQRGALRDEERVDESRLIERAIEGDGAAARALYDAHVDRVYRLCYRLAGEDDLAQDFTQEAFVRAFTRLPEFRREAAFGTWLFAIATSVSLNGLRRVKRFRAREVAPLEEHRGGSSARPAAGLAGREDGEGAGRLEPDLKDRLRRAIDGLPEGYRTVFIMHDLEGYTHEEIAAALGVQPGTSKSQLFRARARLREELAEFAGEWAS